MAFQYSLSFPEPVAAGTGAVSVRSLTGAVWRPASPAADPEALRRLVEELDLHPLTAACLLHRGWTTPETASRFLAPTLEDVPSPHLIRNLDAAAGVLASALERREPIRIVGDYDCDGTTGLVVLRTVLQRLQPGAAGLVSYYVPDREREGYGLNTGIVERAAADGVRVLVSVDIGVTAHREWSLAKSLGLTGVCLDHHTAVGARTPDDAVVVCPKQAAETSPERDFAACGLAWQTARALLAERPNAAALLGSLTKLVAIGTYADMVSLASPANRALVVEGLKGLNTGSGNFGLAALLEVSGLRPGGVSAGDLGFRLGPRINAAGRVEGDTIGVVELFDSRSPGEAAARAKRIDDWNTERRRMQARILAAAEQVLAASSEDELIHVVAGPEEEGWRQGVVGIAAAKLVERRRRPVLAACIRNGVAHGSGRSIPSFNLIAALEAVGRDGLLLRYGGHPAAAGFTLPAAALPELHARLNAYARERLTPETFLPTHTYDAFMAGSELTPALAAELARLEPHGVGNPAPRFILRGQVLWKTVLRDEHLKFGLSADGVPVTVLWWGAAPYASSIIEGATVEVLGRPERDDWGGRVGVRLTAFDVRTASAGGSSFPVSLHPAPDAFAD